MNATTAKFFTTEYNHTQSSRALGWNTNDPTVDGEFGTGPTVDADMLLQTKDGINLAVT